MEPAGHMPQFLYDGREIMTSLCFHAERLHDDRVWTRVRRTASGLARHGHRATFFVYPWRAQAAGKDIAARVRLLAGLGHEIGQHTHFYSGRRIDKPFKRDDVSAENMTRCLRRDFEALKAMGARPAGFTAGGWIVNSTVLDTLMDLGFAYDCSFRLAGQGPSSRHSPGGRDRKLIDIRGPVSYMDGKGRSILCLPTTSSLGDRLKSKSSGEAGNSPPPPYRLVYMHDYDLLRFRIYSFVMILLVVLRIWKKADPLVSACAIAGQYGEFT